MIEFETIITPILTDSFRQLGFIQHHNTTRLLHSLHVAYIVFIVTRWLHLNYIDATRGALLHDYFVEKSNSVVLLCNHPKLALQNARSTHILSRIEEDIILKHMFPLSIIPPKYIESWIVTLADKYCAILEYTPSHNQRSIKLVSNLLK